MIRRPAAPALAAVAVLTAAACGGAPSPATPEPGVPTPSLIPLPASMERLDGTLHLDDAGTVAVVPDTPALREAVEVVLEPMRRRTGLTLPVVPAAATVTIRLGDGPPEQTGLGRAPTRPGALDESYRLQVSTEGATLDAAAVPGLLHGLRTLDQLVADDGVAPAVSIQDEPRFSYRGLHLDVGRHFFPVEFVERYVDLLSRYKLNAFHWHLTEDQGWRIEIDRYPRLTTVAAFRPETRVGHASEEYVGDGRPYGGYYTKEEVRRVVAYAAERGVTVIPEIELPGHARAAVAAYPELGCRPDEPVEPATTWGVFDEIFCPSETTFTFLENVLDEVVELFPSEYVHIGGDEAPKTHWETSELAQEVIRREGLADEHELQSWFIRRIEAHLHTHGRRIIGWDEILEGGLAPDATVMSWRGEAGGIEAAEMGHDVIMTPNPVAYLDHYQGDPRNEPLAIGGFTPIEEVYEWEPIPEVLSETDRRHVLGGQGNLWTEYVETTDHVEYMIWPRALALSEVLWSPAAARDLGGFQSRMPAALERLDDLGVRYRMPEVRGAGDRLVLEDRATIELRPPVPGWEVLVAMDGGEPTTVTGPLRVDVSDGPVAFEARARHPDGRLGPVSRGSVRRGELHDAVPLPEGTVEGDLSWSRVEGSMETVEAIADLPLRARGTGSPFPEAPEEDFGLVMEGWVVVPETGVYTFHLGSDDGSRMEIHGQTLVDNDGLHGPVTVSAPVALAAGAHPIRILYFQAGGGATLTLHVTDPEGTRRPLRPWLYGLPG